jgi:hypothetical protein
MPTDLDPVFGLYKPSIEPMHDMVMHAKKWVLHISSCQVHNFPYFACNMCSYFGFALFCVLLISLREV